MNLPKDRNLIYPAKNTRHHGIIYQESDAIYQQQAPKNQLPYNISYSATDDGKLQIDFWDKNPSAFQYYDTTRIIVDGRPNKINGKEVYNCDVSWYGQDDAIRIERNGQKIGRQFAYENVLVELDLNLLEHDDQYVKCLMTELLKENRVRDNLNKGLQDCPDRLCGNYMGGVEFYEQRQKYSKYFNYDVGAIVHNSDKMLNKRARYKQKIEQRKQEQIQEKKNRINKLQNEINDLEEK